MTKSRTAVVVTWVVLYMCREGRRKSRCQGLPECLLSLAVLVLGCPTPEACLHKDSDVNSDSCLG